MGQGPALILLHGAGQTAENLRSLAGGLAGAFTVYVPDRRTADRTAFRYVPRFLLAAPLDFAIRRTAGRPVPEGEVSPRDLVATVHYDAMT